MNTSVIVAAVLGSVLFLIVSVLFFKQLKGFFSLVLNTALGWAGLYIFNSLLSSAGIFIGINIASASIVGVLGIPGLVLLVILKFIYK